MLLWCEYNLFIPEEAVNFNTTESMDESIADVGNWSIANLKNSKAHIYLA